VVLTYIRAVQFLKSVFLLFCIAIASNAFSQTDTITLSATVTDGYVNRPLSGVSIVNPQSSVTIATNASGFFEMKVRKQDYFFLFYPGYRTIKFSVADSAVKSSYVLQLVMEPLSTGLSRPVIIRAPKTLEEIEEDRKKLGLTPRELEKPEMVITSPISALYEILSNRAREREKLKQQMAEDAKRRILWELLNFYNENGLIDLPEEHYNSFINYSNLTEDFLKYSTDYEITKAVVTLYNKYGRETGIIK
jgi:hypothetical protein